MLVRDTFSRVDTTSRDGAGRGKQGERRYTASESEPESEPEQEPEPTTTTASPSARLCGKEHACHCPHD